MSVLGVKIFIAGGTMECRISSEAMNKLSRLSKDNNTLLSSSSGDTLFLYAGAISGILVTSPYQVNNFTYFSEVEIIGEIPEWEDDEETS